MGYKNYTLIASNVVDFCTAILLPASLTAPATKVLLVLPLDQICKNRKIYKHKKQDLKLVILDRTLLSQSPKKTYYTDGVLLLYMIILHKDYSVGRHIRFFEYLGIYSFSVQSRYRNSKSWKIKQFIHIIIIMCNCAILYMYVSFFSCIFACAACCCCCYVIKCIFLLPLWEYFARRISYEGLRLDMSIVLHL